MNALAKWALGTIGVAGLAAAVIVPKTGIDADAPGAREREAAYRAWQDAVVEVRVANELAWRAEAREAVRALPRQAGTAAIVRIDPRVTARAATGLREQFDAELRALGDGAPRHPVALIVVVMDSVPARSDALYARSAIVLPERAGDPCATVVFVPARFPGSAGIRGTQRALGPCAFYAQYGTPSEANNAWMRETRATAAAFRTVPHGLAVPTKPIDLERRGRYAESSLLDILACRAGDDARCRAVFSPTGPDGLQFGDSDSEIRRRVREQEAGVLLGQGYVYDAATYVLRAGLLARLADQLGPDRFGALWRGPVRIDEALPQQLGRPVERWVYDEVVAGTTPYSAGPTLPGVSIAAALAIIIALGALAIARSPRRLA